MAILERTKPCMKVCMMGPRAVGKTTILTAVFNETKNSISDTFLKLTARGDTDAALDARLKELKAAFKYKEDISTVGQTPNAGLAATAVESEFLFSFGILGKEPVLDMEIKDFPGERVDDNPQRVTQFIRESTAVFIAIDTPHMMELDGKYNEVKNRTADITKFFRQAINDIDKEKLVILIPLKCEKYQHERRMSEVLECTKKTYSELVKLFSQHGRICCTIAPIITLGGVEFECFNMDDTNQVIVNAKGVPEHVKYKYVSENAKYQPLFCSQPLYAMLSFIAAEYQRIKDNGSIWEKLKDWIRDFFESDSRLFSEILKMEKHRISDNKELGYEVVCGGQLFHYNH